mgnify:CR=1 FL=1
MDRDRGGGRISSVFTRAPALTHPGAPPRPAGIFLRGCTWVACHGLFLLPAAAAPSGRPYRLPAVSLKTPVIWGATCEVPGGPAVAFGGQDQKGEDGDPHTRIKDGDAWVAIHQDLRARNPLQGLHDRIRTARDLQKDAAARARAAWFAGLPPDETSRRVRERVLPPQWTISRELDALVADLDECANNPDADTAGQARQAAARLSAARAESAAVVAALEAGLDAAGIKRMAALQIALERAAEPLGAEPPPRALSPLAFDAKTGLVVLFGGDHLDYLTNDTWVFDPAKRTWRQRRPAAAPPPRANHALAANGDGTVTLTGGYTYTSSTDYCGGQYRDLGDGPWTYDVAADAWTGAGAAAAPDARTYRTGRLHPDHCLDAPPPSAAAFAAWLEALPPNTWTQARPPARPALNRDWGSAVLDPDRDLILRWSGGHSAHGGTDVLHYHLRTNRWELAFPAEFPLGQLYANTEYPDGFNFNRRPWVTGHTYQSYGVDPFLKKLLFVGRTSHCYLYDPDRGDWTGRFAKPKGMAYQDCYYTLTLCPTPRGLMAWTEHGRLFRFDAAAAQWVETPLSGAKLPGSVVDNSTMVYDAKRDRLLAARKPYGDRHPYDGELHAVDLATGSVSALSPAGREAARAIPYLCQIRYDVEHDLMLVGATLPPGDGGARRTPAYDCAGNRWISLAIGGDDPSGKNGRNVSLGMIYDAKRRLFWAVDADSRVYVLRLAPDRADVRPLGE